ncbi:hypothetical protein [Rhodococcus sp. HNM0569]|uniref:hypothetical protein n=1 Tax=Rhodococcus sp. HNM0569 TaxID=2716340 RepID=UPI00146BE250|nr:hypothetical protein [Rhodococcus sp. HNM0569]NLU81415.1 hypothetical protein [Rhodococcus sp. HNM0569]
MGGKLLEGDTVRHDVAVRHSAFRHEQVGRIGTRRRAGAGTRPSGAGRVRYRSGVPVSAAPHARPHADIGWRGFALTVAGTAAALVGLVQLGALAADPAAPAVSETGHYAVYEP